MKPAATNTEEFFDGMEVKLDSDLTDTAVVLKQHHRFVEYEPKDEWWLIKYGFATVKEVPSLKAYMIELPMRSDMYFGVSESRRRPRVAIVMHPDTWDKIKKELKEREKEQNAMFELPITRIKV